jgi:aconitate hydratase
MIMIWSRPQSFPETAISKRASTRTSKANFLMSPPLVVAFALAGRVDLDLTKEPIGKDKDGKETFLRDLWPSLKEVRDAMQSALSPDVFRRLYRDFANQNPKWNEIPSSTGDIYQWDEKSDYIHEPPFFKDFSMEVGKIQNIEARAPSEFSAIQLRPITFRRRARSRRVLQPGQYLISRGIKPEDFNSYGSRRGNDLVMTRGTFANVRIKNLMVPGTEGGVTKYYGPATGPAASTSGEQISIYDAAMKYQKDNVPLVILAGHEYGTGSSRDWAAKGTRLLGVKAVIAASFERIHRSNLVGMGVLPLQFPEGHECADAESGWLGSIFDHWLVGLN